MEGADPGTLLDLVWLLVPLVLAYINTYLFEGLQSAVIVLKGLPGIIKQLLYVIIQYLLLKLSIIVGLPLPEALEGFTPEIMLALTTSLVGMGLHTKTQAAVKATTGLG